MRKFSFLAIMVHISFSSYTFSQEPELVLPVQHTKGINSIQFSADDKYIITCSNDNTTIIREVESGRVLKVLEGYRAKLSPDSKLLATISTATVNIYDLDSLRKIKTYSWPVLYDELLSFSPDSKFIAVPSASGELCIYDVVSGKLVRKMGKNLEITALTYSPDGKKIALTSKDVTSIWDIETRKMMQSWPGYNFTICQSNFSPDSKEIVLGYKKGTAMIWDVQSGKSLHQLVDSSDTFAEEMEYFSEANYSMDGKSIVTVSGGITRMWEAASGRHLFSHWESQTAQFSPDSRHYVTACSDSTAKIWDAHSGELEQSLGKFRGFTKTAVYSRDGRYVAACPEYTSQADGTELVIWESKTGLVLHTLTSSSSQVLSAAFIGKGNSFVSVHGNGQIKTWDLDQLKISRNLQCSPRKVWSAVLSPDEKSLLTFSDADSVILWDIESGKLSFAMDHADIVTSACFSKDGNRVVTSSWDQSAKIWDSRSGQLLHTLSDHPSWVMQSMFSPDDTGIATVCQDGTVRIWDAGNGLLRFKLRGAVSINSAEYSPDGKMLMTVSSDYKAQIWDCASGKLMCTLPNSTSKISAGIFNPDGKRVVTAGPWGVMIWDIQSGEILKKMDYALSADFSPDGKQVITEFYMNVITDPDYTPLSTIRVYDAESGSCTNTFQTDGRFLDVDWDRQRVLCYQDAVLSLYNLKTGKAIISLIAIDENDYMIFTPDLYYSCSQNAARLVSWRIGKKLYELDKFNLQYNRPDIILERLGR